MDVILNTFLASVAFLYVANQSLPALAYLSTIDKVILMNFTMLILEALIAVAVKVIDRGGNTGAVSRYECNLKLHLASQPAALFALFRPVEPLHVYLNACLLLYHLCRLHCYCKPQATNVNFYGLIGIPSCAILINLWLIFPRYWILSANRGRGVEA